MLRFRRCCSAGSSRVGACKPWSPACRVTCEHSSAQRWRPTHALSSTSRRPQLSCGLRSSSSFSTPSGRSCCVRGRRVMRRASARRTTRCSTSTPSGTATACASPTSFARCSTRSATRPGRACRSAPSSRYSCTTPRASPTTRTMAATRAASITTLTTACTWRRCATSSSSSETLACRCCGGRCSPTCSRPAGGRVASSSWRS
mmetsp:Transcript_36921/g.119180  ORF Transcript_36921/g.119180 Transcript_36921/m.119180 type:complete len:203 (+) Transcript_36921:477-1085(+)